MTTQSALIMRIRNSEGIIELRSAGAGSQIGFLSDGDTAYLASGVTGAVRFKRELAGAIADDLEALARFLRKRVP